MLGHRFTKYIPPINNFNEAGFEELLKIFMQLITYTSGDASEALSWLNNLDDQYNLTGENYGIGDFIKDLKEKGYLTEKNEKGEIKITPKTERTIRKTALEEIFGKLKKTGKGNHNTKKSGKGIENITDTRRFQFGDSHTQISLTDSIKNAHINHGFNNFFLTEEDLEVTEQEYRTQTSTVLMIDISHSMILYGEDRITPAKKVAMALAEMITTKYPKDTLDIIVFGNDAWQIQIKDLPYLQVGPYHTNTIAGLELARDILRRKRNANRQIFMITDGKPTCMKQGIEYYKNSFGLDKKILKKTMDLAVKCRRANIPVTTFMIASDPYLKEFVEEFTKANQGNAYYSDLKGLGNIIFEDYKRNRKKRL